MQVLVLASSLAALVVLADATTSAAYTASNAQLPTYADSTECHQYELSTSSGCPVQARQINSAINTDLLRNEFFVDSMTHLLSERLPERVVHAKGAGAFGYFEVTHNVTDLCKAKFLSEIGKQTPIAARFSPTIPSKGGSDISSAVRGFSVKFYTEEGNWDMTGMHTPIFAVRDPIKFVSFVHAIKRNPATDLVDFNMTWDFITLNPESFFTFLMSISPYGVPDGNRHMLGHSIHTMQLANSNNETNFARFYFKPDQGFKNFTKGSSTDTDYFGRDLYNAIGNGSFPSWTVYLQPLTMQDVLDARAQGIDVFDVSRTLSEETYPLRQIGKMVLNENPTNHFAEVEQLAFCPGNVVPGIVGAPDKLFVSRSFAYRTAQIHRLGINFNKIDVNRPKKPTYTYNRDGRGPVLDNEGGAPNYYPNTFNGPQAVPNNQPDIIQWEEITSSNFDQIAAFYQSLNETEKEGVVGTLVETLSGVTEDMTDKVLNLFESIDEDLYGRVATVISNSTST